MGTNITAVQGVRDSEPLESFGTGLQHALRRLVIVAGHTRPTKFSMRRHLKSEIVVMREVSYANSLAGGNVLPLAESPGFPSMPLMSSLEIFAVYASISIIFSHWTMHITYRRDGHMSHWLSSSERFLSSSFEALGGKSETRSTLRFAQSLLIQQVVKLYHSCSLGFEAPSTAYLERKPCRQVCAHYHVDHGR